MSFWPARSYNRTYRCVYRNGRVNIHSVRPFLVGGSNQTKEKGKGKETNNKKVVTATKKWGLRG